jgi:hypothetical protein
MDKALRHSADIHDLPAIIVGVSGVLTLLPVMSVVGGYLIRTP